MAKANAQQCLCGKDQANLLWVDKHERYFLHRLRSLFRSELELSHDTASWRGCHFHWAVCMAKYLTMGSRTPVCHWTSAAHTKRCDSWSNTVSIACLELYRIPTRRSCFSGTGQRSTLSLLNVFLLFYLQPDMSALWIGVCSSDMFWFFKYIATAAATMD